MVTTQTTQNALPTAPVDPSRGTVARLSTFDGSVGYDFLINPEEIEESPRAEWKSLPVLNTAQPLLRYKYSQNSIRIPRVLLYTPGNAKDLSEPLRILKSWTMPDPDQKIPKLLKFTWGASSYPRVYLVEFPFKVSQWRNGVVPTMASGSMVLLEAPETPEVVREAIADPELSEREREEYLAQLRERLRTDQALRDSTGLTPEDPNLVIAANGNVTSGDRQLGNIRAILGVNEDLTTEAPGVRPGLANLGQTTGAS